MPAAKKRPDARKASHAKGAARPAQKAKRRATGKVADRKTQAASRRSAQRKAPARLQQGKKQGKKRQAKGHAASSSASAKSYAAPRTARGKGHDRRLDALEASSGSTAGQHALAALVSLLIAVGAAVGKVVSAVFHAFFGLLKRSRAACGVFVVLALLVLVGAGDAALNSGKVYANVSIGEVDVGGMTREEAQTELARVYGMRVFGEGITIYADQEAMDAHAASDVDPDQSVEDVADATVSWVTDASSLQVRIDYDALVDQAMAAGRGGIVDRLSLFFFGCNLDMDVNMNEASLESLAAEIDAAIGDPYVNWSVVIDDDGICYMQEGHDGTMVDRSVLSDTIEGLLLADASQQRAFVAEAVYTPAQIDAEEATAAADKIAAAIADGVTFSCDDQSWAASAGELGSWVAMEPVREGDGWVLSCTVDEAAAKSDLFKHFRPTFQGGEELVTFNRQDDGSFRVQVNAEGTMPAVGDAVSQLADTLFSHAQGSDFTIEMGTAAIPSDMSFDEALDLGIVSEISTYTTTYTTGAEARNHNIHLAADLLDGSIASANGGVWSFNETAGECNAEKGFQAAGSIVNDETTDEIGGGICQVATTVFNAVYEAGYGIVERHNHSLYISSYPAGRDAAINWPDLDLRWENDTASDVLLRTSYTDSTLTVTLYGVDPGRSVETVVGDWEEGEEYETVYKYDSSMAAGYSYTQTNGRDGQSIVVVRTVYDSNGDKLWADSFSSAYSPKDEVIVRGGEESDWPEEEEEEEEE